MKLLLTVVAGLLLALGPLTANDDDRSGVCVGSMEIVACVPPDQGSLAQR